MSPVVITASFQLPFSFSKGEKDEMKLTAVTRNPVHSCPTLFFLFLFTVLQFFFFVITVKRNLCGVMKTFMFCCALCGLCYPMGL